MFTGPKKVESLHVTEDSHDLTLNWTCMFTGPKKVESLLVTEDSHDLTLNWTKPSESDACIEYFVIEWKSIAYKNSSEGSSNTTEEFFVIEDLEACVDYEVSVTAVDKNKNNSEPEVRNVTTLTDGK
jgi:hypothetical protein